MPTMPEVSRVRQPEANPQSNPNKKSRSGESDFISILENNKASLSKKEPPHSEKHCISALSREGSLKAHETGNKNDYSNNIAENESTAKDGENVSAQDNGADKQNHSEDGLKRGSLLFELINNYVAEIENASQGDSLTGECTAVEGEDGLNEAKDLPENGLKIGHFLNELISTFASGLEGAAQNGAAVVENNVEAEGETAKAEAENTSGRGLKIGELITELLGKNAPGNAEEHMVTEDGEIDENTALQNKEVNAKAKNSHVIDSIPNKEASDKSASYEGGFKDIALKQTIDNAAELCEHNGASKGMNDKLAAQIMQGMSNDKGLRSSFGSIKVPQYAGADSEGNSIHAINNAGVTAEGGKSVDGLMTGHVSRNAGFNEVLNNVVYVVKGSNKLGVTVEHEHFGKLDIDLNLDKGMVNVHINTADKTVREFIENNIQHIVDNLMDEGVSVGGFSVALKEGRENTGNIRIVNENVTNEPVIEPKNVTGGSRLVSILA